MRALLRLFRIAYETLRFAVGTLLARLHLSRSRLTGPERLCLVFAGLGTTFIKFGQALSMRQDILPSAYAKALRSLQENVVPFSSREAIREIEGAFGQPVDQLFAHFDREPVAGASIAQVHTAELRDGRKVIVKVRRIGIEAQIDHDMRALRMATGLATALAPHLKHYQPSRIVDEIWSNLRKRQTSVRKGGILSVLLRPLPIGRPSIFPMSSTVSSARRSSCKNEAVD